MMDTIWLILSAMVFGGAMTSCGMLKSIGGNTQKSLDDFLWLTFTRSDPAQDIYGLNERFVQKHWAIDAPLIVDATIKPRHQKALVVPDNVVLKAKEVLENAR